MTDEQVDRIARDLFDEILGVISIVAGGIPLDIQRHAERQCVFGIRRIVERLANGHPEEDPAAGADESEASHDIEEAFAKALLLWPLAERSGEA